MSANSVSGKIAENLVSVLDGKSITYGGASHTLKAERLRIVQRKPSYPYVEVAGPWSTVEERDNRSMDCDLMMVVTFYDRVNDKADASIPASEQMQDVHSELIKLIMADITRGHNALKTDIQGWGDYVDNSGQVPEYVVYVNLGIQSYILSTNPDSQGS